MTSLDALLEDDHVLMQTASSASRTLLEATVERRGNGRKARPVCVLVNTTIQAQAPVRHHLAGPA